MEEDSLIVEETTIDSTMESMIDSLIAIEGSMEEYRYKVVTKIFSH